MGWHLSVLCRPQVPAALLALPMLAVAHQPSAGRPLPCPQDPSTLVSWKHNPKNALFYGSQKDVVPYSGAGCCMLMGGSQCV